MNVSIKEKKFSIGSQYDIYTGDTYYHARKAIFSFTDDLEITTSTDTVVAKINGFFSPIRARHEFVLRDGRTYQFHCEKLWTRVFVCEGNQESYQLYEHKHLKYSIFRNDLQVAAATKNRMVVGSGNEYEIQTDSNADVVVILCLMLTINSTEHSKDDSSVTVDLGNLAEERAFDESWTPS